MTCHGRCRGRLPALLVLLALCTSLAGCAWLDTKQRQLALRPSAAPAGAWASLQWQANDQRLLLPSASAAGQQLALWWLPHANPDAPTLLYLHGTLRHLVGNASKIDALRAAGFSILAVDYRGWGESTPIVPSEASIMADAWQAWAELQRRQPQAGRRVLFGHSMGSAVAVALASQLRWQHDYGALALEAAFTRMPDVAAAAGFWGRVGAALTTLDFDAAAKMPRVDAPVWMLHGDADTTVPITLGERLRNTAPPGVHWVVFAGGSHSRLHQEFAARYLQVFQDLQAALVPPAGLPTKTTNPNGPHHP